MLESQENKGPAISSLYENAHKKLFFKRERFCPLSGPTAPVIDYKNVALLSRYISERGRVLPSRITSISAKKQRELRAAIKRARIIALLPFVKQS
jgi:small subunit ribosomal protein S18